MNRHEAYTVLAAEVRALEGVSTEELLLEVDHAKGARHLRADTTTYVVERSVNFVAGAARRLEITIASTVARAASSDWRSG